MEYVAKYGTAAVSKEIGDFTNIKYMARNNGKCMKLHEGHDKQ